ncbi:type IVB secretion system protein IcmG/DotF [Legionella nagasakiensis]|uniref:type IVB secretion system protein IcmG/DotF n=1 Tax=Legionella nagasakiensis TaxID=535290 RepID=UPI001055CDCE|nr:type IVB secretion system protein IcmG/DotF [Legionella nagasakiensis]
MADNDQYNDEYQFSDLDALSPEPSEESQGTESAFPTDKKQNFFTSGNLKRNVLIIVGMVILAMIVYKFLGAYFADRKTTPPVDTTAAPSPVRTQPVPAPTLAQPVQPIQPIAAPAVDPKMSQKLSALEVSQQSMRSEVNSVSNQLGGISSNVNELSTHLSQLNQAIAALNAKIDEQSHEIEQLMIRTKPKPAPRVVKVTPVKKYYVQAVIPGRAWLISSNGTTLTVREGSIIPGYGIVKLIDPNQGRVTTSTGQVIRFSQNDS